MIRWLVWMYRGNHQCYGLKSVSLRGIPDFPDWEPWLLQFWAMKPRGFVASHDFWEPTFLGVALNKPMSHFYLLRIFFQPIFGVGVGLIVVVVVICCYLLLFVVVVVGCCCLLLFVVVVVVCCCCWCCCCCCCCCCWCCCCCCGVVVVFVVTAAAVVMLKDIGWSLFRWEILFRTLEPPFISPAYPHYTIIFVGPPPFLRVIVVHFWFRNYCGPGRRLLGVTQIWRRTLIKGQETWYPTISEHETATLNVYVT